MMLPRGRPGLLSWVFVFALCVVFAREAPLIIIAVILWGLLRRNDG